MKNTVYLAGPMLGYTSSEMNRWRSEVAVQLIDKYNIINPARREYASHEFKFIVENDKFEIDNSDILFVNHITPSDGTSMEILYSWERKKTVITVVNKIYSPWIEYHSTKVFDNIDAAIMFLNHDFLKGDRHDASELRNSRALDERAQTI